MKRILITSALPYVNNVPHLGNIIGSVLSADVFARICRLSGYDTFFVCATDEYGTATETKALEEKTSPQAICDKYHALHSKIYQDFDIEFDFFGRTSFPEQTEVTQQVYLELEKNGFIKEKASKQFYCEKDQLFLADRFVEGRCPHCNYLDARGDQCENCSRLLQPNELKDARCKLCGRSPSYRTTNHLELNLPKLEPVVYEFFKQSSSKGKWPENAVNWTDSWFKQGFKPRPITRDLKWGVPVPKKNYEQKVFYVWFDAVLGYISNSKRALGKKWQDWWLNPDEVLLYQFMAKDNIPFHSIIFPAMLLGTKRPWTMPHHIASVEYLNYEGKKFSKSRHTGVFGSDVKKIGLPIDWWRLYLLANRPETSDTSFNWHDFRQEINANFIDNIGNLVNRCAVFATKNFDGLINDRWQKDATALDFKDSFQQEVRQVLAKMEAVQLRAALHAILNLGRLGNKFFQDCKPWILIKNDPQQAQLLISVLLLALRDIAILLQPFIPSTASAILQQLNFQTGKFDQLLDWSSYHNHRINPPKILFTKLEAEKIDQLQMEYGGDATESPQISAFKQLKIVIGKIIAVSDHKSKNHLYVLTVVCGLGDPITVAAGLKNKLSKEELIDKSAVFVLNLVPLKFDAVLSQGMILTIEKNKKLEVLQPHGEPGCLVSLSPAAGASVKFQSGLPITLFKQAGLRMTNGSLTVDGKLLYATKQPIKTRLILNGKVN